MPKPLNFVVACAENRVIGHGRKLPWQIPEDMAHFHAVTAGQTVVLGRVCYEIWPRVALDGRQPVVITSQPKLIPPGVRTAGSVEAALAIAQTLPGEIMICGGQRIYEETLDRVDRIYLTLVHATVAGDVYFPEWRHLAWRESAVSESRNDAYRYTFSTLERIKP